MKNKDKLLKAGFKVQAKNGKLVISQESPFKAPTQDELLQRQLDAMGATKNADGSYDVAGDVDIAEWLVKNGELLIKFRHVKGDFDCCDNNLTSLKGAPKTVGGGFWCRNNNLTSLEGAPKTVGGYFDCSYNNLTSLEGAPVTVGGYFDCSDNKTKFTIEDVKAVSKVKGEIFV